MKEHLIDAVTPYLQSVSILNDNEKITSLEEMGSFIRLHVKTEGGAKA